MCLLYLPWFGGSVISTWSLATSKKRELWQALFCILQWFGGLCTAYRGWIQSSSSTIAKGPMVLRGLNKVESLCSCWGLWFWFSRRSTLEPLVSNSFTRLPSCWVEAFGSQLSMVLNRAVKCFFIHMSNTELIFWCVIHWVEPPPNNSDHQDQYMFSRVFRTKSYLTFIATTTEKGDNPSTTWQDDFPTKTLATLDFHWTWTSILRSLPFGPGR